MPTRRKTEYCTAFLINPTDNGEVPEPVRPYETERSFPDLSQLDEGRPLHPNAAAPARATSRSPVAFIQIRLEKVCKKVSE
jgi:hypothetical protein